MNEVGRSGRSEIVVSEKFERGNCLLKESLKIGGYIIFNSF